MTAGNRAEDWGNGKWTQLWVNGGAEHVAWSEHSFGWMVVLNTSPEVNTALCGWCCWKRHLKWTQLCVDGVAEKGISSEHSFVWMVLLKKASQVNTALCKWLRWTGYRKWIRPCVNCCAEQDTTGGYSFVWFVVLNGIPQLNTALCEWLYWTRYLNWTQLCVNCGAERDTASEYSRLCVNSEQGIWREYSFVWTVAVRWESSPVRSENEGTETAAVFRRLAHRGNGQHRPVTRAETAAVSNRRR